MAEVPSSKWIACMSCTQHAQVRRSADGSCMIAHSRRQPALRPVPNDWAELQCSPQHFHATSVQGGAVQGLGFSRTPGTCLSGCWQLHAPYMRATASGVGVFPHRCGGRGSRGPGPVLPVAAQQADAAMHRLIEGLQCCVGFHAAGLPLPLAG